MLRSFCGVCENCRAGREQYCTASTQNIVPTQAEYVVWSEDQVYKLPDDADMKTAALVEPMTIALHAVEKAQIRLGDRVAVSGGGGIGMMVIQLCKMAGASEVTLIEPVEAKRELAETLGADYTISPMAADFSGQIKGFAPTGYDVVIECSETEKRPKRRWTLPEIRGTSCSSRCIRSSIGSSWISASTSTIKSCGLKGCFWRPIRLRRQFACSNA
jgi:threonine dehydrogenase-like Zn-dependent dehydrogenase